MVGREEDKGKRKGEMQKVKGEGINGEKEESASGRRFTSSLRPEPSFPPTLLTLVEEQ